MNQDDFKKILTESLAPLSKDIQGLKTDVSSLKTDVSSLKRDVGSLKTDVSSLKTDVSSLITVLGEVKNIQEGRVLPSVVYIEQNIKVYADMYKLNNDNMKKLEKRVEVLEDKAGVTPEPEQMLVNLP